MTDEQVQPADDQVIKWVYSSSSVEDVQQRYDIWAQNYESDLADRIGYVLPQVAGDAFASVVEPAARILDAGVGTGLVGALLAPRGFADMTGIDISQGMLDVAAQKGVYKELHHMELGLPLDFPSDHFDATICIGSFGPGHAPASSLDELIRVTKPGGTFMFNIPIGYASTGVFDAKVATIIATGAWELVSAGDDFPPMPISEPDVLTNIWHYRVR
jgi:SAM-dependent methyltransferase